jgi:hypothetical protein
MSKGESSERPSAADFLRQEIKRARAEEAEIRKRREALERALAQLLHESGKAHRRPIEAIREYLSSNGHFKSAKEITDALVEMGGVVFHGDPKTRVLQSLGKAASKGAIVKRGELWGLPHKK